MRNQKLKMMILAAMFAALTAICAQITLNIPPVPFTLQTLAVSLAAIILGGKYGALAIVIYILIGAFGAPVFAGFKGGFQYLLQHTGGYLIGFIVAAYVIGFIVEKGEVTLQRAIFANIVGLIVIYALGVTQLKLVLGLEWAKAFGVGMVPFLIPDLIKLIVASIVGVIVRRGLIQSGLLDDGANRSKLKMGA